MGLGIAGIMGALGNVLKLLTYFFDPGERDRRRKEKSWKEFRGIEADYRKALATGDPQMAAQLDKKMREMRAKHKFLNK